MGGCEVNVRDTYTYTNTRAERDARVTAGREEAVEEEEGGVGGSRCVWTTAKPPRWSYQSSNPARKDSSQPGCYFWCSLKIDGRYLFPVHVEVISLASRTN